VQHGAAAAWEDGGRRIGGNGLFGNTFGVLH
jgi:hypothetical protein